MKYNKKSKSIILMSIVLLIAFISGAVLLGACSGKTAAVETTAAAETQSTEQLSEQPDKELFDKYFSNISLGGPSFGPRNQSSTFGDDVEKNICTLLPHQEAWLVGGFNYKKNFIFRIAVLDLETNDFVERCATTASSEGSDGFGMEALEWAFLRPGIYEYRIYVEDTLVAVLPFEVISYVDYFFGNSGEEK